MSQEENLNVGDVVRVTNSKLTWRVGASLRNPLGLCGIVVYVWRGYSVCYVQFDAPIYSEYGHRKGTYRKRGSVWLPDGVDVVEIEKQIGQPFVFDNVVTIGPESNYIERLNGIESIYEKAKVLQSRESS